MLKLKVNDIDIEVEDGLTVLQACEKAGAEIPRFCYHEKLSIAGNCRMCLVEMEKSPKPVASCAMPATDGMIIKTNTEKVEKARKGVMEFLLANHPLDCPVCDQGGECDLQDQSMYYGIDKSRFKENKRNVPEKYMGPLIKTQMTRCIHCTRCIRFATEVAGVPELGAIGRGEDMQITTYLEKAMQSELSANVIDLCPVGALTSKPYVFEARPWELKKTETIDVMDAVGSNVRIDTYGWEVKRILPRINEDINEEWISDKSRYACDGLKYQRLDTPYLKIDGKLKKTSWNDAYNNLINKLEKNTPSKIAGFIGDLVNMENMFSIKEFFEKTMNCENLEIRHEDTYINLNKRDNYIFNSSINGIEESDLIILIGTNPRLEATILNSRIRKSFIKNKFKVFSFTDVGDLTYPYEIVENNTKYLTEFCNKKGKIYSELKKSKRPMIICGSSFFKLKNCKFLYEGIENVLNENKNLFDKHWKPLNILSKNASTVGGLDLNIVKENEGFNSTLNKLKKNEFDIIFLFGQDQIVFDKKNEFVVYVGHHGDLGAEIADIILPCPAYTEQDGFYTNLEGKIQKSFKSSFPLGNSKEEWEIVNDISEKFKKKTLFKNRENLVHSMKNYLNIKKIIKNEVKIKEHIEDEIIFVDEIDYYHSNVIARASKTMSECKSARMEIKKTGTDG